MLPLQPEYGIYASTPARVPYIRSHSSQSTIYMLPLRPGYGIYCPTPAGVRYTWSHSSQGTGIYGPTPARARYIWSHSSQGTVYMVPLQPGYVRSRVHCSIVIRESARGAGDRGSIPVRVTPKTYKIGGLRFSAWRLALMS